MGDAMTETICEEIFSERSAICEFDGLLTREEAEKRGMLESETYRKSCEIRTVLDMPLSSRAGYMDRVEKLRGAKAANELREAVRDEWFKRRAADARRKAG